MNNNENKTHNDVDSFFQSEHGGKHPKDSVTHGETFTAFYVTKFAEKWAEQQTQSAKELLEEKDREIAELETQITKRSGTIQGYQSQLSLKDGRIKELEEGLKKSKEKMRTFLLWADVPAEDRSSYWEFIDNLLTTSPTEKEEGKDFACWAYFLHGDSKCEKQCNNCANVNP